MVNLSSAAQRLRLLEALNMGGEIATSECREYLNVMSPAARVFELRRMGYDIVTERRRITDSGGFAHLQAVYVFKGRKS